ncbi:MAG: phosphate acyltransferase PlsX, partial [Planctomycetes bacterium]|nr:phosphate acyltransferase PlsX [Planctomycetota bacterium]
MRIALDAMGGDLAPGPNLQGAVDALAENPDLEVVRVGDRYVLEDALSDAGLSAARLSP